MGLECKTILLFHFYNALHSTTEPLSEPYPTYHKSIKLLIEVETSFLALSTSHACPGTSEYFSPLIPNQWFIFIKMTLEMNLQQRLNTIKRVAFSGKIDYFLRKIRPNYLNPPL